MLNWVENEKCFIISGASWVFCHAQLSWARKKFYNFGVQVGLEALILVLSPYFTELLWATFKTIFLETTIMQEKESIMAVWVG